MRSRPERYGPHEVNLHSQRPMWQCPTVCSTFKCVVTLVGCEYACVYMTAIRWRNTNHICTRIRHTHNRIAARTKHEVRKMKEKTRAVLIHGGMYIYYIISTICMHYTNTMRVRCYRSVVLLYILCVCAVYWVAFAVHSFPFRSLCSRAYQLAANGHWRCQTEFHGWHKGVRWFSRSLLLSVALMHRDGTHHFSEIKRRVLFCVFASLFYVAKYLLWSSFAYSKKDMSVS